MLTGFHRRALALLAALPLLLSTPVEAGSMFGPAELDNSIDLSVMGAKFPKRDKENKEGEILVKFNASVPAATRDAKHIEFGNLKLRELKRSGTHHVRVSPDQTLEQRFGFVLPPEDAAAGWSQVWSKTVDAARGDGGAPVTFPSRLVLPARSGAVFTAERGK